MTKVHHQSRKAADISLAKRQISPTSHRAVLDGDITLQYARDLGRDGAPRAAGGERGPGTATEQARSASATDAADAPPQPASRNSKDDRTQECWCGCQELTSPNRKWRPGHDQRGKGIIRQAVKEGKAGELSPQLREYGEERGLI